MNACTGALAVGFLLVLIQVYFDNTDLKCERLGTPTSISESPLLNFFYLSISLYFFSQIKPCSPPSFFLGTTNSTELYLELVTTVPLPAKWDAVE